MSTVTNKGDNKSIRLIIADDHPIVRDALKNLIKGNHMVVVAEAENGNELLNLLDETKCDLVVLDMSMPGHPVGTELVQMIIDKGEHSPPVLVFSMSNDARMASAVLKAGASGYITKDSEPAQILEAIHKVAEGGKYISHAIAEQILFNPDKESVGQPPHKLLSRREYQIFLMLLDGKSSDTIASELCISRQTVGSHKARLMQKLGLQTNVDIVRYAVSHGLISF
jgi:DNA-binding NarL/FixJ family response regulator